jgi:hypothetical protein
VRFGPEGAIGEVEGARLPGGLEDPFHGTESFQMAWLIQMAIDAMRSSLGDRWRWMRAESSDRTALLSLLKSRSS